MYNDWNIDNWNKNFWIYNGAKILFCSRKMSLVTQQYFARPPCLPPFWDGAKGASLHDSLSVFSYSFFRGSLRRPNHCYYGRSPRSHTRFLSLVHIPMHPPFARSPPPSAIDFGQANYIFSPIVERIKLWYSRPISRRSPPALNIGRAQKPPKNDSAKFVGATDAPNANNHGGGLSSRDLRSIVF